MGDFRERLSDLTKIALTSDSSRPLEPHKQRNLSSAKVISMFVFLCIPVMLMIHIAQIVIYPVTARYAKCGHIVLVSTRRHGSTWFISNADGCLSVNGSYGNVSRDSEIWHHGSVKNVTVEQAVDLVRFNRSLKIFPPALDGRRKDVRTFLEVVRDFKIPVFLLRRHLQDTFVSLQEARKTKVWNIDRGSAGVERKIEDWDLFAEYKKSTETYFNDMKSIMKDVGIAWDELQYEMIVWQSVVLGETANCYIENCNFK